MRRPSGLAHRFVQYSGGLAISSVTLAELFSGAYKLPQPRRILAGIADLLQDVAVIDFDSACAEEFGKIRGSLREAEQHHAAGDDGYDERADERP